MRKKEEEGHENNERWLLTYSDLITLLMIFFIVMYASSNISNQKYGQIAESLGAVFGGSKFVVGQGTGKMVGSAVGGGSTSSTNINLEELKKEVDSYLKKNNLGDSVATSMDETGLAVKLKDSILFSPGNADITLSSKDKMVKLAQILSKTKSYIRIEGHTDNIPTHNSQFNSNWQLSSVRAANVAELLINNTGIDPSKVVAVGCGEYRPVATNKTPEGRAKNRRVEIIVINDKYNQVEKK